MNRSISSVVAIVVPLVVGMVIVVNAFTGGGNTVAQLAKYLMISFFVLGVMSPRISIYIMIVMTGYLDMMKRVMVLDVRVSFMDLYYVLGMSSVMLAGVTLGLLVQNIRHGKEGHWKIFLICTGLFVSIAIVRLLSGFTMSSLGEIANNGAYLFMIYALWNLIRDNNDIRRLLLFLVAVYIPVAVYTLWQSTVGLADFEIAYLATGLSNESRQFGELIFRPFSTMNSAGNVSNLMGVQVVLCLYIGFGYLRGVRPLTRLSLLLLIPLFGYAAFLTYSRGGWVCAAVATVAVFMFGTKLRLILFYASGLLLVAVVALSAERMLGDDTLMNWSEQIQGSSASDKEKMVSKIQTFNSRLSSIDLTLRESKRWRPFGIVVEGDAWKMEAKNSEYMSTYYVHDGFSLLLMKIGYIPLAVLAIIGVCVMYWIHMKILSMTRIPRRLALLLLGLVVGIASGFTANQVQLVTFPVNFYLYFFMGICIVIVRDCAMLPAGAEDAKGLETAASGHGKPRQPAVAFKLNQA